MYTKMLFIFSLLNFIQHCYFTDFVKRYADGTKTGHEPYESMNNFPNQNNLCFFAYCWNRRARCSSNRCCTCKCETGKTFYSEKDGCTDAASMLYVTKDAGESCHFVVQKSGYNYVPLFFDENKFSSIELTLSETMTGFDLMDSGTSCSTGQVHHFDYHGHKLLYHQNKCHEIFNINRHNNKYLLQWVASTSKWNSLKGRLLTLDIHCYSSTYNQTYVSCLLFQIEGKFIQGDDAKTEFPPNYNCTIVTTIPPTQVTETTHQGITYQNATYKKKKIQVTTQQITPQQNTTIYVMERNKTGSANNTFEIATGIGTAVFIIGLCFVLLAIRTRRRKNKKKTSENGTAMYLIRQPVRGNDYGNAAQCAMPDVPSAHVKKTSLIVNLNDGDDGDEDHYYKTCVNMVKRPLPEQPIESENPCYEGCGVAAAAEDMYCTINDIQES